MIGKSVEDQVGAACIVGMFLVIIASAFSNPKKESPTPVQKITTSSQEEVIDAKTAIYHKCVDLSKSLDELSHCQKTYQ